ncbi:4-hydroxy-tetrahydrodipicolinate synthase [bacterium]|nr:4-hydroxy-tetrahydrodipicolinate synthase [bacterium]
MKGVYTAIITPFKEDGKIDFEAFGRLLDKQEGAGVSGVVVAGTTGEGATLALGEKEELFRFASERVSKLDLVAGTGTNNTADSVRQTEAALKAGFKTVLAVTPYYNKPTPKGLFAHYSAIAATGAKIVLYNVPGRTGLNISPLALSMVAKIENVVAVKEATGDIGRLADYLAEVGGERFDFLSGDDFTVVPFISMGGKGVISVFTNIFPEIGVKLVDLALAGDFEKARKVQIMINRLNHSMFMESNPIPVKTALAELGLCKNVFRPPLATIEDKNLAALMDVIRDFKAGSYDRIMSL